jgi:hypothetical protein
VRMRALALPAALLLGAATAFLVACGSGDGRIPAGDASSLETALDQVSVDFHAGRCQSAQQAVTKAQSALVKLPNSVDSGLRARLRSGVTNLSSRVEATCGQAQTQTQTQETQTQTNTQTDTNTDTNTDTTGTDTTGTETGTTSTGTTSTGTTSTGTTSTGTTSTGTTGTTTGGGTGGAPSGGGTSG